MPETIEITITIHTWTATAAFIGLTFFGVFYAMLMAWFEQKQVDRGICAPIVALGATVTLLLGWLLPTRSLQTTGFLFAAFAAAGLPIMGASFIRFVSFYYRELTRLKKESEPHEP